MNTAFKRRTYAIRLLMLLVLPLLIITSCKKKFDEYYGNTGSASVYVYDKLRQDTNFSIFADGLDRVGLVKQINSGGLYTVFAPVNDAFKQYFAANGYASIKDVPQATLFQILNFHITNNLWYYYSFQQQNLINSKGLYLTRGGKFLQIDLTSKDTLKVNGIPVIKSLRDISSDNAVIHGIGTLLIPKPNLEQVLSSDSYLKNSTFYKLMQVVADSAYDRLNSYAKNGSTQIDSIFYKTYSFLSNVNTSVEYRQNSTTNTQGGDPVFTTILMPKDDSLNAAIAPALARIDNSVTNKIAALSPTYVKGILSPYFMSDTFSYTSTKFITKPAGVNYLSTSVQTIPTLTAASFYKADLVASNGIAHVINFNFPQSDFSLSVVGQASMDPQLSMFMLALQRAGLTGTYAATGKAVTLFAPTNAAFTAANFDVKNMILDGVVLTATQFNNIIKNHIIEQNLSTPALLTGSIATVINLNNNTLTFSNNGTNATTILGLTTNIVQPYAYKASGTSTNGFLYKIDKILIPSQ